MSASDGELNFMAFTDGAQRATPDAGGFTHHGPMQPPADVARLLDDGIIDELPPRRPYSVRHDAYVAEAHDLGPSLQPMGEPLPKEHSDGTVRVYRGHYKHLPSTIFVADRDDRSLSKHGDSMDLVHFADSLVTRYGRGDYVTGVSRISALACASTGIEPKADAYYGHLSGVKMRVMITAPYQ